MRFLVVLSVAIVLSACGVTTTSPAEYTGKVCKPLSAALDKGAEGSSAQAEYDSLLDKAINAAEDFRETYNGNSQAKTLLKFAKHMRAFKLQSVTPEQATETRRLMEQVGSICGDQS